MTVLSRGKSGATLLKRGRDGQTARGSEPEAAAPTPLDPGTITVRRQRRAATDPQDHAMYTCHCGYMFEAPVSTSVSCPQCSDAQAW